MNRRLVSWRVHLPAGGALLALSVCTMILSGAGMALADEPSDGDKAELQVLKARLEKLERKVTEQEASTAGASTGNSVLQLPSGLQGVQMSGFVDTSVGYNFNSPHARLNTLRVFDTESQSFLINNAELILQKPVSADSPVGFMTSLMFGTDAPVVGAVTTGLGPGTEQVQLKDAYAEYLAPIGEGLDLKVGKFVTLHGAEVIGSKDNWNFSQSYLFGFAIPFTHTGVRATYPWTKWLSTTVGVNNGWDVVKDNNQVKTLETSFTLTPNEKTSLITCYMVGGEQPTSGTVIGSNSHTRHLIDVVASYQPLDPLQLKANFDYGYEEKGVTIGKNSSWVGLAGYARYALNDRWALATRAEWFHDADGVRTAFRSGSGTFGTGSINGISGFDLNLWEWTLTNEFKLNKHLISRVEYRHDQASEHIFRGHGTQQRPYQDTIGLEFIAPF